jgi:ATP-dependent Lon protease
MVLHFDVGREKSILALEQAMLNEQLIFLVSQKDAKADNPSLDDIYSVGTVSRIKQILKLPGDTIRVLVEGLSRNSIETYTGRTAANKIVNFKGKDELIGKLVKVRIDKVQTWSLEGTVMEVQDKD